MNLIIFDFEVFKYNVLLGAKLLDKVSDDFIQTWDLDMIKKIYAENTDAIWIGHNNAEYDNYILQAIITGKKETEIKALSDYIISSKYHSKYLDIKLYYWDLMKQHPGSLKTIECAAGENIVISDVDFALDRSLTDAEKRQTEIYNKNDIERTEKDFYLTLDDFLLRLDIIAEFNLPWEALHVTSTQLAEMVLHASPVQDIENELVPLQLYDNLKINNQAVLDYFLSGKYKDKQKLNAVFCGTKHTIGIGGIHGAKQKYFCPKALYFDVSGYYNLIMINYNLLSRAIPDEYKAYYKHMYEKQLELKKTNPAKRAAYKVILLSVFGATMNPHCKFYDPQKGVLITITGQLFLIDLLEKLEGKADIIQSNTDGIIAAPLAGVSDDDILRIVEEWEYRTGFVLKYNSIYDIYQRDVNCYMYRDDKGAIHTVGATVKYFSDNNAWDNPMWRNNYNAKEPLILQQMIVDYFMYGSSPEKTCEKYKNNLRLFQFIAKKNTYAYCMYEETDTNGNVTLNKIGNINRAFACNAKDKKGMIYKYKADGSRAKMPCLPDNVCIYNRSILDDKTISDLQKAIDFDYYIRRGYEQIAEFLDMKEDQNEQRNREADREYIQQSLCESI